MPTSALALVLVAALLHAGWNLVAKRAGGDHRFQLMSGLMVVVVWAPAALWFGWHEVPRWGAAEWGFVAASAAVHLLYFQALLTGYRVGDLTVVYPLARGTGPLVSALGAIVLLGELPSVTGIAGLLGVCAGIFVIAGGPSLWRGTPDPARRTRRAAGVRWGLLTGCLIAAYTLIDGIAVKLMLMGPVAYDYFCNALRVPMLLPAAWRDRPGFAAALRTQWKPALAVAVMSPLAYILVLYAMTMAPLSHVAPAREVSLLVAALLGGHLLGEGDRGARLAGAACIAVGVMLLGLPRG